MAAKPKKMPIMMKKAGDKAMPMMKGKDMPMYKGTKKK